MRILAIECSAGPSSCAVTDDGKVLAQAYSHTGLMHSRTLLPMVDSMLKNADIKLDSIDMFAVSAGPGSFTGVRIGVAAVKGMAFAKNTPCVGVSSLAAMARTKQGLPFDGVICAAMDARCNQVYTALFESEGGQIQRLTPDLAIGLDELYAKLENLNKSILLVGDGAELCYNSFCGKISDIYLSDKQQRYQNAVGVAVEAEFQSNKAVKPDKLMPIYLRLPQAERELKSRKGLKNV